MAEPRLRVEAAPVQGRIRWRAIPGGHSPGAPPTGEPSPPRAADADDATSLELFPVRRATPRDGLLAALALAALIVAVLKPWGSAPLDQPSGVGAQPSKSVPLLAVPSATSRPLGPVLVPETVVDPDPANCLRDVRWHVCVLGEAGGRGLRNVLDPNQRQAGASPAPVPGSLPVIVLLTTAGAGLAFYAPEGATADGSRTIDLSAWRQGNAGARSIALESVAPTGRQSQLPANVFVPPDETLVAAAAWPTGRYIFWLQGPGLIRWQEYFAIDVVALDEPLEAAAGALTSAFHPVGRRCQLEFDELPDRLAALR